MQQVKARRRATGGSELVPLESNIPIADNRRAACPALQYTVPSSSENVNSGSELET